MRRRPSIPGGPLAWAAVAATVLVGAAVWAIVAVSSRRGDWEGRDSGCFSLDAADEADLADALSTPRIVLAVAALGLCLALGRRLGAAVSGSGFDRAGGIAVGTGLASALAFAVAPGRAGAVVTYLGLAEGVVAVGIAVWLLVAWTTSSPHAYDGPSRATSSGAGGAGALAMLAISVLVVGGPVALGAATATGEALTC